MIPDPQRTYVLDLLAALGPAADDFVVASAQAMKFTVAKARGTKVVASPIVSTRLIGLGPARAFQAN
jgi:hypothetical protein